MKTLLWLDDYRNPVDPYSSTNWLVFSPIEQPFEVIWCKSYNDFVEEITYNGLPDAICFDHDLSDFQALHANDYIEGELPETEKTGFDCAKWLIEYCIDNKQKLPLYNIQSANPVGKENIDKLLKNFIKCY